MMRLDLLAAATIGGIALRGSVAAQNYPARPVRIIVPFSAGGGLDIVLRERYVSTGLDPSGNSPEPFVAEIHDDIARRGKVARAANVRAD